MEDFIPRNSRPEVLARRKNRLNLPEDQLWKIKTQEFDLISDFLASQPSQEDKSPTETRNEPEITIPDSPISPVNNEEPTPVPISVAEPQTESKSDKSTKIEAAKPKGKKIPIDKSSAIAKSPIERKSRKSSSTKNKELKAVHSMILDVIQEFDEEENDDESFPEIEAFKKEISADLKEYTALSIQRRNLGRELRQRVSTKKKLRKSLLSAQKEGQNIIAEIAEVKNSHKQSEEKRKKLEQAHDFLNHFEILQEDAKSSKEEDNSYSNSKNFHSLVRSIATQSQMLSTIQGINSCLRAMNSQIDLM